MSEILTFTLDKFTFIVAADRRYHPDGLWAMVEGHLVRVGVSDYFQQRNGDIAFADVLEAGAEVKAGGFLASLETIKVSVDLPSPVTGTIVAVNPSMDAQPEVINMDPYGEGWLALIDAPDWAAELKRLMDAQQYLTHTKAEAREEVGRS